MKNKYIVFAGIGVELVGIIGVCLYIGQKLDENFGLKGLGMVGFSIAGLAGWLIRVVQMAKKLDKQG